MQRVVSPLPLSVLRGRIERWSKRDGMPARPYHTGYCRRAAGISFWRCRKTTPPYNNSSPLCSGCSLYQQHRLLEYTIIHSTITSLHWTKQPQEKQTNIILYQVPQQIHNNTKLPRSVTSTPANQPTNQPYHLTTLPPYHLSLSSFCSRQDKSNSN